MRAELSTQDYSEVPLAAVAATTREAGTKLAMVVSGLALAGLWFAGQGGVLRIAVPAAAGVLALVFYFQQPISYVRFTLWVWFLTPLIRRIVDWRFGFIDPSLVLLAPFLVSGISVLNLLPTGRRKERIPVPFVLCGVAILYGFVVGMTLNASVAAVFGLLNWMCPMLFGLHLYLNWPEYEQYQAAITKTFVWGLLILGMYGVYQFFAPPVWDRYWLENVMATSPTFGLPEALQIRVWSTMNSPGPFANAIMAGLLLLIVVRSRLKVPAGVFGYLAFLLSIVRTAWLSWLVGLLLLMKSAKPQLIARVLLSIILLAGLLAPLATDPRIGTVISDRFSSFSDLGHDESAGARMDLYRVMATDALHHPFGYGLDTSESSHGRIDSGILALVFSLGWLGSLLFLAGVLLVFRGKAGPAEKADPFYLASKAITIAILAQILSGPIFVNVIAATFWVFAGMYLGAVQFHQREATAVGESVAL